SPTHIAQLTELTREDNSRFFEGGIDEVPQLAVTQGIGTILQSRMPAFACKKEAKADAIRDSLAVPSCEERPGSLLQHHQNCILYLDEAAATQIDRSTHSS